MDYMNENNRSLTSTFMYGKGITNQVIPAAFTLSILAALTSGTSLQKVFELGLMEHMAGSTLPLSLAFSIIFCGLALTSKQPKGVFRKLTARFASYWATFTISLSAIAFGVSLGALLPFAYLNGLSAALAFLVYAILMVFCFGLFAHGCGVVAHSDWSNKSSSVRRSFGIFTFIVGFVCALLVIHERWLSLAS